MNIRVLTLDDEARIREAIQDPRLLMALDVALETSLRRSEILSLRIEQLWNCQGPAEYVTVRVKGGRRERVYIPLRLRESLQEFISLQRQGVNKGWLFVGSRGGRLAPSSLWEMWRETQARAGIADTYRWHDLRHTAITWFEREKSGGRLPLVQKYARHLNGSTTMLYAHPTEQELREAMEGGRK